MQLFGAGSITPNLTSSTGALANLWNPGTRSIWLLQVAYHKNGVVVDYTGFLRTSARGTAAGTTTPGDECGFDYQNAPPSGALLDYGIYSVEPSYVSSTAYLYKVASPTVSLSYIWRPDEGAIEIPPGQGVAVVGTGTASPRAATLSFVWGE